MAQIPIPTQSIDFPQFWASQPKNLHKIDAQPIFEYLKVQAPTEEYNGLKAKATRALLKTLSKSVEKDSDILWNFTKFLISRDGTVIKRYAPTTDPKDFEQDIEAML